jgi:hypothetical protein
VALNLPINIPASLEKSEGERYSSNTLSGLKQVFPTENGKTIDEPFAYVPEINASGVAPNWAIVATGSNSKRAITILFLIKFFIQHYINFLNNYFVVWSITTG